MRPQRQSTRLRDRLDGDRVVFAVAKDVEFSAAGHVVARRIGVSRYEISRSQPGPLEMNDLSSNQPLTVLEQSIITSSSQ
jgi:hypothetical protein